MYQIKQSEATAARRRIPVLFVGSTDGFTPTTPTSPAAYISVNGGTFVATTNAVTLETLAAGQSASGCYYLELTAAEVGTLGVINVNIQSTNCRQYNAVIQVMAYDAYDLVRLGLTAIPNVAQGTTGAISTGNATGQVTVATNNDKTGYSLATAPPTAAQISTQVWSEALPGSFTSGQAGNIVNQGTATSIWAATTRTLSAGTNIVLAKGTGITGFNDITSQSVWDVLAANVTTASSIGLQLKTNIDTTVSSRLATSGYTTPPTSAAISTQVWSEALPGSFTSGQAGFKLDQGTATNIWGAGTRTLTAGTNIVLAKGTGITGFNDISAQNVWDVATSGITVVGSIGVKLNTNVDTTISSRMATFTYTTPPTVSQISTQVWSEPIPGTFAAGSAGAKLNSASSAGDPWATALPGSYATGTAGNILGNRLDVVLSTRLASASYTTPPTATSIATQVWSETLPGSYTSGQAGFKLNAAGSAADPWSTALPGAYSAGSAGFIIGNRLDTNVGSRMATFTLPTNFSSLAITVGGAITAGTVSDKTGYSLSASQTFNTTGSVGSVSGTVGSVSNVSNIWDYLTSNILTTNSIGLLLKTNVDAQISTRLASSSYTVAPTVTQIWQQAVPGTFTLGQAGYVLGTNLDAAVSSRLASSSYSAAPSASTIMSAIWNQVRATANGGSIPAVGTFGYYLDSRVSTAGGSGGGGVVIKQGPFKLNATQDMGSNDILDLVQNDARNIVLEVIDEVGEPIPLSGSYTYTVNVYDIGGTGAGTYTGTVDYANGGQVSFDITTTTTATKGTYYVVLSIDNGTIITKYGGLRLEVR